MAFYGTVSKFFRTDGIFITPDDGSADLFAHVKVCPDMEGAQPGEAVTYDTKKMSPLSRPIACNVTRTYAARRQAELAKFRSSAKAAVEKAAEKKATLATAVSKAKPVETARPVAKATPVAKASHRFPSRYAKAKPVARGSVAWWQGEAFAEAKPVAKARPQGALLQVGKRPSASKILQIKARRLGLTPLNSLSMSSSSSSNKSDDGNRAPSPSAARSAASGDTDTWGPWDGESNKPRVTPPGLETPMAGLAGMEIPMTP